MGQIADLQEEHRLWVEHNFPDQEQHQPLLGIIEEVGELSHVTYVPDCSSLQG